MTPPAYREKLAQLVPNWNSIGMPVTTPIAKLMTEDRAPEPGGLRVSLVSSAQAHRLEHDDEQREPHGELRKQIVEGDRERELQPVDDERAIHDSRPVRVS